MGRSIGSFDSNDGATPLVAGPIASVLALQARSSYWTSARGNPPGHWSPPGAHQKDRGTGGGRLLPASRLGPSGLPTPGLDRTENGTGGPIVIGEIAPGGTPPPSRRAPNIACGGPMRVGIRGNHNCSSIARSTGEQCRGV